MPASHDPPASRVPPLSAVRAFEAAARHQSFTRAAEELGMTQAAVSYQIRLLEDRIGTPLFVRQPRQVTLTATGQKLAGPVTKALNALANAFAEATRSQRSVLSITALHTLAMTWLTPRLADFQAANPGLEIRVDASERLVDFADEPFDVGVRFGAGGWPGLIEHKLFNTRYTPVCTPELRDQFDFREPADLLKARLLGDVDGAWRRWFAEVGAADAATAAKPSLTLYTQTMDVQAALRSYGVALVMPMFFNDELSSGRLVQPFPHMMMDEKAYWLIYPEGRAKERKIRLFREWLLAEAATAEIVTDSCSAEATPKLAIPQA
ncbi:transcriptional regulator GcvA [Terrarubrum flagellatum]|uniref:transcriptional regulator GcvA n=1 Tax=Terrirubrum flagellatum TaxID=2895980 RepID=UPI0031452D87